MQDAGEATRNSILGYVTTWVILEVICFLVMPRVLEVPSEAMEPWLIPSVAMGILGSVIAGFTSGALAGSAKQIRSKEQKQTRLYANIIGTIAFVGVVFPLLLTLYFFWQTVAGTDWEEMFNDQPVLDQLTQ